MELINRIPLRAVFFSMAIQITLPGKSPLVDVLQFAAAIGADDL